MSEELNPNNVHLKLDEILVEVQQALVGDEKAAKACIEKNFPVMYNYIHDLQSKLQFTELNLTEAESRVSELETKIKELE